MAEMLASDNLSIALAVLDIARADDEPPTTVNDGGADVKEAADLERPRPGGAKALPDCDRHAATKRVAPRTEPCFRVMITELQN